MSQPANRIYERQLCQTTPLSPTQQCMSQAILAKERGDWRSTDCGAEGVRKKSERREIVVACASSCSHKETGILSSFSWVPIGQQSSSCSRSRRVERAGALQGSSRFVAAEVHTEAGPRYVQRWVDWPDKPGQ